MSKQLVDVVLFARYNASNFKALYGRIKDTTTYTKDYIQIPESVSNKLKQVFGATTTSQVEVEYVWPGGSQHGHFAWSTDRYHLKWDTDKPPRPWRLGKVGQDPTASLPGDTSLRTEGEADAQLASIESSASKPWLLAVKLAGEGNRLNLRVYFENPAPGFEDRALSALPKKLRDAIAALAPSAGTGIAVWSGDIMAPLPPVRAKKIVEEVLSALARDPNVLLVGPPGTGKSVALEDLRHLYSRHGSPGSPMFDPDSWSGSWSESTEARSVALVFHPSYTYENFVAGLFPKSSTSGGIELEAKPGPLLCLGHWVGGTSRRGLLILDEFNRGPAASIFGDTLSLLDTDKRSAPGVVSAHIQRPYPGQDMPVPISYRQVPTVHEKVEDEVRLPLGVHIVAAMNSTDRSVAPLDAAMRRRFTVIRVGPDYEALAEHLLGDTAIANQPLPTTNDVSSWDVNQVCVLAIRLLESLNERIEYCLGEDFLLGHALVWRMDGADVAARLEQLAIAVDTKIVPTLRTTFIDQDDALAAILGVPDSLIVNQGQSAPTGTVAYWKAAPAALASIAPKRLALQMARRMPVAEQLVALRALTTK